MSDSDLDAVINGDPQPEVQPEPEAVQEAVEPITTEEPEPEVVTPEPESAKEAPMVPLAALQEVRRELQEMKARLPQPEAPKAPNVFDDPDGYQKHLANEVSRATQNVKLDLSEDQARATHTDEVVDAAFQAFTATADPATRTAILGSRSPWMEVVKWHKQHVVSQEIGSDPAAYAAKVEAEVRAKVEAEMVAKQARDNAGKFAPSMANVTGTGGGPKASWAGPTALDQLFPS